MTSHYPPDSWRPNPQTMGLQLPNQNPSILIPKAPKRRFLNEESVGFLSASLQFLRFGARWFGRLVVAPIRPDYSKASHQASHHLRVTRSIFLTNVCNSRAKKDTSSQCTGIRMHYTPEHCNLSMVLFPFYFGGKSHVSIGQNVSFKQPWQCMC